MGWRAGVVVVVVRSRSFGVFGVDDGIINETRDCCAVTCGVVGGATSGEFTTITQLMHEVWLNLQKSHIYLELWLGFTSVDKIFGNFLCSQCMIPATSA